MTPIFTFVPFGPFSLYCASWLVTIFPTNGFPSTLTILSPAIIPALSAGPLLITFCTRMVSSRIVNSIPTPENDPFRSSFAACTSFALIYTECGSSSARILGIAASARESRFTLSTYLSSIICNRFVSLLLPEFIIFRRLPEK